MSELDLFAESQESDEVHVLEHVEPEMPVDLKTVLSELKALQNAVNHNQKLMLEIKAMLSNQTQQQLKQVFSIETSTIKKPYMHYLKSRFFEYPWITEDDADLKRTITTLLRTSHEIINGDVVIKCYQFASHNFTNWRNQLRIKLITKDKDVQGMDLSELSKYTFSNFKCGTESADAQKKNGEVVLALRTFVDQNQLWNGENVMSDFMGCFRKTLNKMYSKENQSECWARLRERQLKKLKSLKKYKC